MGVYDNNVLVMLADGFEEIEALTVVDLLRRAGIEVKTVSIYGGLSKRPSNTVKGARGISVNADISIDDTFMNEALSSDLSLVVLPGGMPGTLNLKEDKNVEKLVMDQYGKGKCVAAICAAPTVFGSYGILEGKKATCYPGMEDGLTGATAVSDGTTVVVDSNVITSRGLGTAVDFSLKIIEILKDKATADKIGISVVYNI